MATQTMRPNGFCTVVCTYLRSNLLSDFLLPTSHQRARTGPEHLFIGKLYVLPLLHRPFLVFSPEKVSSLDVRLGEHGPLDHPTVNKAQFLQAPAHLTNPWFLGDLNGK